MASNPDLSSSDNTPPSSITSNRSGGSDVNAGRVDVTGDVVGRDKFILNNPTFIQKGGLTELSGGDIQKLVTTPMAQATKRSRKLPKKEYKRERIYNLELRGDHRQISDVLSRWRFVHAIPAASNEKQPFIAVANEIIGIGQHGTTTFDSPPIQEIKNCSVECELRIKDDSADLSLWAGIRVRGFVDDIQFGYLVYLRKQGTVELYRAQQIIGGENDFIVKYTKEAWTKIRLDVFNSKIKVWVNGKLHIDTKDRKFSDKGSIYLHCFGVHTQFRNFRVYKILR